MPGSFPSLWFRSVCAAREQSATGLFKKTICGLRILAQPRRRRPATRRTAPGPRAGADGPGQPSDAGPGAARVRASRRADSCHSGAAGSPVACAARTARRSPANRQRSQEHAHTAAGRWGIGKRSIEKRRLADGAELTRVGRFGTAPRGEGGTTARRGKAEAGHPAPWMSDCQSTSDTPWSASQASATVAVGVSITERPANGRPDCCDAARDERRGLAPCVACGGGRRFCREGSLSMMCLTDAVTGRRSGEIDHTAAVLPELARDAVDDLLVRLDRVVPHRIEGFYVVDSAGMGAFRAGRSDVDFVALVNGTFGRAELARLRAMHVGRWTSSLVHDLAWRRRWPLVCNGIYLRAGDLSISPLEVTPLAGHVTGRFRVATREGFDVNPVTWRVLAEHGIAVRGPNRDRLEIRTDEAELRAWTLANLNDYWLRWAARATGMLEQERRAASAPRRVGRTWSPKAALHDRDQRDRDQGTRRALRARSVRTSMARADRGRGRLPSRRAAAWTLPAPPRPPSP